MILRQGGLKSLVLVIRLPWAKLRQSFGTLEVAPFGSIPVKSATESVIRINPESKGALIFASFSSPVRLSYPPWAESLGHRSGGDAPDLYFA